MKKILFGIALILFGFSMEYFSYQNNLGITELISLASILAGLGFSVLGLVEKEK